MLYKNKVCLHYIQKNPIAPVQVLSFKIRMGFYESGVHFQL